MQSQSKGDTRYLHKTIFYVVTITSLASAITANSNAISEATADESRILQATSDTSTPNFGACFNTLSDTLVCALGQGSCRFGDDYFKPSDIISLCDSPFRVELGRCTGDLGSCTPYGSSCESKASDIDPTCSLVEDKSPGPDKLTHYPYCQTKDTQSDIIQARCVLSEAECRDNEEEFLDFEASKHLPLCFCTDVPTGMCFDSSADMSADTSFCALTMFDCPVGYSFMSAYDLSTRSDAPRKCRLCDEGDIEKYRLHEDVVESGRCNYDDNDAYGKCVLEETECNNGIGETFQSSSQLADVGFYGCHSNIFPGGDCPTGTGGNICVNYAEACESPAEFVKRESCTIFADTDSPSNDPMYFGKCQTPGDLEGLGFRCVWHKSECGAGEQWLPASEPTDWYDGCKCEDVETGACLDEDENYYCAVSDSGCALEHTYVSSLETKDAGLDCRLCQRSRIEKAVTASPTKSPVRSFDLTDDSLNTVPENYYIDNYYLAGNGGSYDTYQEMPKDNVEMPNNGDKSDDDTSSSGSSDDSVGRFSEEQREADLYVIIAGTVGGTFLFTFVALFFWFQDPLPVKLYRTDENVTGDRVDGDKGDAVARGDMV